MTATDTRPGVRADFGTEITETDVRAIAGYASWLATYRGVLPTLRELPPVLGLSDQAWSSAHVRLAKLVAHGWLRHAIPSRGHGAANDLVLTPAGVEAVREYMETDPVGLARLVAMYGEGS